MNILHTRFNKANWSAAVNALIVLANNRLPAEWTFDDVEQGLLMTLVTFAVVVLVPNAEPTGRSS